MKGFSLLLSLLALVPAAQASIVTYAAALSGANENPATVSAGTGFASFRVDTVANTVLVNVNFAGLTSPDSAAHIHCCVAAGGNTGVATALPVLPGFPMGVTSGSFTNQMFSLLDPTFYNPAFITANGGTAASAEAVLLAGFAAGTTYFNIHTTNNPGGEIRGFLTAVPEPGTLVLMSLAFAGMVVKRSVARSKTSARS
jgi:hypothetical protein